MLFWMATGEALAYQYKKINDNHMGLIDRMCRYGAGTVHSDGKFNIAIQDITTNDFDLEENLAEKFKNS